MPDTILGPENIAVNKAKSLPHGTGFLVVGRDKQIKLKYIAFQLVRRAMKEKSQARDGRERRKSFSFKQSSQGRLHGGSDF